MVPTGIELKQKNLTCSRQQVCLAQGLKPLLQYPFNIDLLIRSEDSEEYMDHEHLLAGTFKSPVAIPQVYQHVCESLSNSWNELVSVYDPLENPKITCSPPTLKSYGILTAIVIVSIVKTYLRCEDKNLGSVIKEEMHRRR